MTRAFVVLAAVVALVATGCGTKAKPVTKAQYEAQLQTLGQDLTRAGSRIGKRIDISGFNEDIANFQDHLRAAAKALHGVKPPATARAANKRLADSFDDLADDFEPVKEARRKSIVEAGKAAIGSRLEVEGRGGSGAAEVVPLPFYRGSVHSPAPPARAEKTR